MHVSNGIVDIFIPASHTRKHKHTPVNCDSES